MTTLRAMRKTSISFGLVNVPVSMYAAKENHDISMKQFHDNECMGAIGFVRTCRHCNVPVDVSDIIKGLPQPDDSVITLTEEELASVEVETGTAIEVLQFISADELDPIALESHYYLAPSAKESLEGFLMLRAAMVEKERVAVVQFSLRRTGNVGKTLLGILRPYGDKAMALESISWPEEIREPAFNILDTPVALKPALVEMAKSLVDSMTGEFDPSQYTDTYTHRLGELIQAKASGGGLTPVDGGEPAEVGDLLAKLTASIAKKAIAQKPAKKAAPKAAARRKVAGAS